MGTVISNLKARFGVDTSDFKKGLKEGEKATEDFKNAASTQIEEFAQLFGVNMGVVGNALDTVSKSLTFLGKSFTAAAKGGEVLAIAMKVLKFALVATGIGAIVVALGSLVAYFTKSGEGADKFAKILDQVKSVINNVIERLAIFGKGLFEIATGKFKQGWETMRGAFKGIGDEIKEDIKASGDLADRIDALEDKEIDLITVLEERKQKISELKLASRDLDLSAKERLDKLLEAEKLTKANAKDEIDIAKEKLAILKDTIALATKDPTDEQRRELRDLQADINRLTTDQNDELRAMTKQKNTLLATVKEEVALEKAKGDQIKINNAEVNKLKLPDLSVQLSNTLAPLAKMQQEVNGIMINVSDAVNSAFESMAEGMGEFLGALMTGDAGVKDFGKMMAASFADLAITVGKIAIKSAIAIGAIDKALKIPGAWPVALAAGIALVAVGSAIRGALANAASGGGSGSASGSAAFSSGSAGTASVQAQPLVINLKGKLVAEGKDLVYVLEQESTRRRVTT